MEKQLFCRYCGGKIPRKGNRMYYCSEACCRNWFYEAQEELFYTPGIKQEKCIVCGKELKAQQLKYCSKPCYMKDRFNRSELITGDMVKAVKNISL